MTIDLPYMILYSSMTIFTLCCLVVNLVNFGRLLNRFIFDGADFRSPYTIASMVLITYFILELLNFIITGQTYTMLIFMAKFYFLTNMSYQVMSRLVGYPVAYIRQRKKNSLYVIFSVLFYVYFFLSILFIPNFNLVRYVNPLTSDLNAAFTNLFAVHVFSAYSIYVLIFSTLSWLIVCWFDYKERRSRITRCIDLFCSVGILALYINTFNVPIPFPLLYTIDVLYLMVPMALTLTDTIGILRRSKGIDTRISTTKNIIRKCAKSKSLSQMQLFQLSFIAKQCINDDDFKDTVISKKLFITSRYRKILDIIRDELKKTA